MYVTFCFIMLQGIPSVESSSMVDPHWNIVLIYFLNSEF